MKKFFAILSISLLIAGGLLPALSEARGVPRGPVQALDRDLVLQAQRQLKVLGFNPGTVDGNLGAQTEAALREYQRAYRLPQTGLLDEATQRSLLPERFQAAPAPTNLSNQEVVMQAQRQLKALGLNPGDIDGNLGAQTEAALREYQRQYRLPQTGTLDEMTARSLMPERFQAAPAPTNLSNREVILQAQRQLKALGLNPGDVDGELGAQTQAALREYQRQYRLPQTGTLDEATARSLMPERFQATAEPSPAPAPNRPGVAPAGLSNREVVRRAQIQLRALGFEPGTADGTLGPQTGAAVREYQRAYRLPQTGTLDEATLHSLLPEMRQSSAR
jgi:peptidoglycan hydrolase-like protein with peptidoglycan-binding domain